METLAINGGPAVRKEKIYYGRQWVDDSDIAEVNGVLNSDFITCGPKVEALEEMLAACTGSKYAVAVNSGTSALHCACIAAGIRPGDEVITTPLTFAASANCVLYCGGRPVFADVKPDTYNIDPESIEAHITAKTKAVIAVDYSGQAADLKKIRDICRRHHLIFIEDAAHAIGTTYNKAPVGSLADMTCFSFHPVKTVTSGEGGAVVTNDLQFYRKLVLAHAHGIVHGKKNIANDVDTDPWYYEQTALGFNYRMTDFQAALLMNQLKRLPYFKERRAEIGRRYDDAFAFLSGIVLQKNIPESDTCRHLYVIRLQQEALACTRRQFFDALTAEGVQPQVHYIPVYWFPYYQQLGYQKGLCPAAEEIYSGIASIPIYPKMSDLDVEDVINAVKKVIIYYQKEL